MSVATITLGIDPTIQVGPVELAWHGIMTAIGLAIAIPIAQRHAADRGRDPDAVLGGAHADAQHRLPPGRSV
jgi:prolipoprotein diacylglyceryltransferase